MKVKFSASRFVY